MGFLNTIIEGLAEVGKNSYTQEEKDMIEKTRNLMRLHNQYEAAEALDEVIKNFYKGITRTPSTTSTSTTTSTSGQVMSTAEFVYELKNRIKSRYGCLDCVIIADGDTINVELHYYRTSYVAKFVITNGAYQNKVNARSTYLYEKEIAACEADIVKACREIRSL